MEDGDSCPVCGKGKLELRIAHYEPEEVEGLDQIEIDRLFQDWLECSNCGEIFYL